MWIPDKPSRAASGKVVAGAFPKFWFLLGHLKPGVSVKEAEADLTVVAKRLASVYPKDYPKHFTVQIESLTNLVVGDSRRRCISCWRRWIVAADRLRERGELAAGAGDHEREGVCDSVGAGSEPLETDPAATGGELDPGDWRGGSGYAAGMGRPEIAGSADAAGHHSGGGSDSPEYAVLLFALEWE